MGAVQAMGRAGAQAPGTEESTACSRNHRDPRAKRPSDKTEAHLEGHMQNARDFSSLSLEQWEVPRAHVSNGSPWLFWVEQIPGGHGSWSLAG